jgi:hypothetical protein
MLSHRARLWLARLLIGLVLFINLQAALLFIWQPQVYAPGFELVGHTGAAVVRGMGVLFLMWNIPYIVALVNPIKYRVSLFEAVVMQTIGLVGESIIYLSLPEVHSLARSTIMRFIIFDAGGLVALCLATLLTKKTTT